MSKIDTAFLVLSMFWIAGFAIVLHWAANRRG